MKAAVLKTFRDKITGAVYAPGEVLTLERERFSEIREKLGSSYIAEIVDPDAEPEQPESDAPDAEPEQPESDAPETDAPESVSAAKAPKGRKRRKAEGGDGK